MAGDSEKPPVPTRKTFYPVSRPGSPSGGGERALERARREQQEAIARQRQEELRLQREAEARAREEILRAGWSEQERKTNAFIDKFDQVVERYLYQCCAEIPGFKLRQLDAPPGDRSRGYEFSLNGIAGCVHHPDFETVLVERISPGGRGTERTLVATLTVDDLTVENVGKAVNEVLGIRKCRGAADR